MDQNELYMLETHEKSNKYYLFLKKITLHFLLPVSLLSFFLSFTSGFSFLYSYEFHLSAIVFPLFTHAFERKYMFLVCNGILAFLAKNLCLDCSLPTVSDPNGELMEKSQTDDGELTETKEAVLEASKTPMERNYAGPSTHAELEKEVEQGEQEGEENETMYLGTAEEMRVSDVVNSEDTDRGIEGGWGPVRASPAEEINTVDLNTEELNRKIEAFISKMKEEIRIEARQQPIAVQAHGR